MNALARGLRALIARDPDMARAFAIAGRPKPRDRRPGFATLLGIIVNQQVSQHAGRAIWGRLEAGLGRVSAKAVLDASEADLARYGLSRAKVRYAKALADAVRRRDPDLDALADLDDARVHEELTRITGIGRWSADIYLMFALGRADVWPAGDLALAAATERLLGLDARPDPAGLDEIGERWRPWRSAAATMLWHFYSNAPQDADMDAGVTG